MRTPIVAAASVAACRTPLAFLITAWREGRWGGLVMGLRHRVFCVGCCWTLMALLFVLGIMNLAWVAVLALIVLVENVTPSARRFSAATGAALTLWGIALVV